MSLIPDQTDLIEALNLAAEAHHRYEQDYLAGERDNAWAGWYAAYLLGRLGSFAPPGDLARWLESAPSDQDWNRRAAALILNQLRSA